MRYYESGKWGFSLLLGLSASVLPRALAMALPNAVLTYGVSLLLAAEGASPRDAEITDSVVLLAATFTAVMIFILTARLQIAYDRWWEGGTLLQKTRGEWFNAYSSLIAFSSGKVELQAKVEEFHHLLARLMSLLYCCALQQVSPSDRAFSILNPCGLEKASLKYLQGIEDREEVIQQWIQRSVVLRMADGILPVPPPVISRVFQEMSRGIVNLQNARKIADFPFPFPYHQISIVVLIIHWSLMPLLSSMLLLPLNGAGVSFAVTLFLWCIHFTALQLESPFGDEPNDLPMDQMIADFNQSLFTLLKSHVQIPPSYTPRRKDMSIDEKDSFQSQSFEDEAWAKAHNIPLCLPPRMAFLDAGEVPEEARGMDDEAHCMRDDDLPSNGGGSEDFAGGGILSTTTSEMAIHRV
ncbi:icmt [Symbiodinium sp. CCMP2592]|nr:icmt [Symbiodinium sp. CCMP2592]